ncbi:hypothetical protein LRP88_03469 [Fusarium phalaenopsidis]|nr:DDE-Tnp-1-7 domain-containing protein [Fusarium sp. Ph1]
MNTQSDPDESQADNAYDDKSFIKETHSRPVGPNDPTRGPNFPAEASRGFNFQPFNVPHRDFKVHQLPNTPLELFQLFVPISFIYRWIEYTNSWVGYLLENGVIDSWNNPLLDQSRILAWDGLSAAQVYVWLGLLIYIGIHKERTIESHWSTPKLGEQRPLHSIIKFMPLWRFQLIHRYLRPFDHTKIDETDESNLPRVFQAAEEWSEHIQHMSALLFEPGSNVAVDECIIRYTGRSFDTAFVSNKPIPLGFKIWVEAQVGFFIRWLWHLKGSKYGTAGVTKKGKKQQKKKGQAPTDDKLIPLNNTQGVVIALCNLLPQETYHVFFDNLFSSADLFRCLRAHGHGATGTARVNSGIHKDLKQEKKLDKNGKSEYDFNEARAIPTPDNKVISLRQDYM